MYRERNIHCLPALASVVWGCATAQAQIGTNTPAAYLGSIVVQAQSLSNDAPAPLNNSGNTISTEQMQLFNRNTLDEALELAPSVVIMNSGARAEKKIVVRGFSTREVLLFVDGIPIGLPYDGLLDPGRFSTKNLSSIELEKGFNSVMNGPNCMGGAINMRSTTPTRPLEVDVETGVFSGGGYEGRFRVGTAQEYFYLQAEGSFRKQDGYPLSSDYDDDVNGELGGRRDHCRYEDTSIGLKGGIYTGRGDEYMLRWIHQEGEKEQAVTTDANASARYWEWPVWNKDTFYFTGQTIAGADSWVNSHLYFDKFDDELVGYSDATYTTERWHDAYDDYCYGGGFEWVTEGIKNHLLKTGASAQAHVHEEYDVSTPSDSIKQSDFLFSLATEDAWRFKEKWRLVYGISYDRLEPDQAMHSSDSSDGTIQRGDAIDTEAQDAVNPQIGLWYAFSNEHEAYLSVARKTRFPTLKDRYSYRMETAIPNPELDEESATHFELGWNTETETFSLNSALFYSDIRDTIASVDNVTTSGESQMQNVGSSFLAGLETAVGLKLNPFSHLQAQYTFMQEKLDGNDADLDHLVGVPDHLAQLSLSLNPYTPVMLTPSIEWNSGFYEYANDEDPNNGYFLVHLDANWSINAQLSLQCGIHNLFDENYELDEGYPEAGRNFYASIRYHY
jgi:iron complex outermembrane receptor protein